VAIQNLLCIHGLWPEVTIWIEEFSKWSCILAVIVKHDSRRCEYQLYQMLVCIYNV